MTRRYVSGVVWFCGAVLTLGSGCVFGVTFAGGDGSATNPYQIATAQQLVALGADPNLLDKTFILIRDLDMATVDPNAMGPIGGSEVTLLGGGFTGEFDGKGHEIKNLRIMRPNDYLVGLFAGVEKSVRNLHLRDITIRGRDGVGGLVGRLSSGVIQNCSVTGSVVADKGRLVGGLVGWSDGEIASCSAAVEVRGDTYVGGLVGQAYGNIVSCRVTAVVDGNAGVGGVAGCAHKNISRCSVSGRVVGKSGVGGLVGTWMSSVFTAGIFESYRMPLEPNAIAKLDECSSDCTIAGVDQVGGLVGMTYGIGIVQNCYALGSVEGTIKVGGLIGRRKDCSVVRCFSSGTVKGKEDMGGLIGSSDPIEDANGIEKYPLGEYIAEDLAPRLPQGEQAAEGHRWRTVFRPAVLSCFWDGDTSSISKASGSAADCQSIECLKTEQMRQAAPFRSHGWDFDTVWVMREGKPYPRLRWERSDR
jgi:hypothetical protein